jgi:hypothetical protein
MVMGMTKFFLEFFLDMHGNGDDKIFLRIQQTNLLFPIRFNRFS